MIYAFWLGIVTVSAMYDVLNGAYHAVCFYILMVLAIVTFALYCIASFTDPGVLLRNQSYDSIQLRKQLVQYGTQSMFVK